MRILVTSGAGFIRGHLTDQVVAEHTRASTGKAADLPGYEPTHTSREGVEWCRTNEDWDEPLVLAS